MPRFEELEAKILDLIQTEKKLNYRELCRRFGLTVPTANRYAIQIAEKYSEYIDYIRGILILKKPLVPEIYPPEVRITRLQEIAEKQSKIIEKAKELSQKLITNHLQHDDRETLESELKRLLKILRGEENGQG
jgi:DeoR/GlpR family transcriptional regulator of sugar metabolism